MKHSVFLILVLSLALVIDSNAGFCNGLTRTLLREGITKFTYKSDTMVKKFSNLGMNFFANQGTVRPLSLKPFTPYAGNCGNCATCTGWAIAYSALTTEWAIRAGMTNRRKITKRAFSSMYPYIQCAKDCSSGAYLDSILELIKNKGDCSQRKFHPSEYNGLTDGLRKKINDLDKDAADYKIEDYLQIFDEDNNSGFIRNSIYNALEARHPIIVSVAIYPSFHSLNSKNFIWQPNPANEKIEKHKALCVIGFFNDSLEIMNDEGEKWGNKGFFTIGLSDFLRVTQNGYILNLGDQFAKNVNLGVTKDNSTEVNLAGTVSFKLGYPNNDIGNYEFKNLDPSIASSNYGYNYYSFASGTLKKDDFFRLSVTNSKADTYVYIIDVKPDSTAELGFPSNTNNTKESPYIPFGATLEIPADSKKGFEVEPNGDDWMCVLFSKIKFTDNELNSLIQTEKGTVWSRLNHFEEFTGYRKASTINSSNKMKFIGHGVGDFVPVILKLTVKKKFSNVIKN